MNDWSIHDVADTAGVSARTLRHYDAIGILPPSRTGSGGYRYYDDASLVRLQRILLLKGLGLGLAQIAQVLDREPDPAAALRSHVAVLREEHRRLDRQIRSVEHTITRLERGDQIMTETMFDGFDHTQYKDEVEQRWGEDAYASSDAWWRGMSATERRAWQQEVADLNAQWVALAEAGAAPESAEAQALARRHIAWLASVPGTPRGEDTAAYVRGLADMYVADPRFAANYATAAGGTAGAEFVRAALVASLGGAV